MSTTARTDHSETAFPDPNWEPPEIIYGSNLIAEATKTDEKYVVVTMEIPWDLVKNEITAYPAQVTYVPDMHLETLETIARSIPDDIEMVFACDGLLTARGGTTSHAAVTAVQLGTVCVVNCRDLDVDERNKVAVLNGIRFTTGDEIAIDGINGSIYKGNLPVCIRTEDLIS